MTIHLFYFHANKGKESSMKKWWFNSMLSKRGLEHRCRLSKSMDSLDPFENTSRKEDRSLNDTEKNVNGWRNSDSSSYNNVDHLFCVMDIHNFISDDTYLLINNKRDSYSLYFDIENQIFEIDNDHSFLRELQSSFSNYWNSSYLNSQSKSDNTSKDCSMYYTKTKDSWTNHINNCIDSYLHSQISIGSSILNGSDNYSDSYILSYIFNESENRSESFSKRTSTNGSNLTRRESSNNLDVTQKYKHLWVQCEDCYALNYKKLLKSKMGICEQCEYYLKMSSSDRIELLIYPGTWNPMDEDMVATDPIEFQSEEKVYKECIDSYKKKTGLTEAVQTGIGQLNGIPVAIGVMDFEFLAGSMGSVSILTLHLRVKE